MSTNSTAAGTVRCGWTMRASSSSRSSGTLTRPMLGSLVANGIVRREHAGGGERVEERGLADVGKSDDAESEHYVRRELKRTESPKGNRPLGAPRRLRLELSHSARSREGIPAAAGGLHAASLARRPRVSCYAPCAVSAPSCSLPARHSWGAVAPRLRTLTLQVRIASSVSRQQLRLRSALRRRDVAVGRRRE